MARRACRTSDESPAPGRLLARLRVTWHAWRASGQCPSGEAVWHDRELMVHVRADGTAEVLDVRNDNEWTGLRAGLPHAIRFSDGRPARRAPPIGRFATLHRLGNSLR